jgi:hypothetical protein
MLTKLVPSWAGWSIALLLLASTLGTWALCRAAALGDQMMFRLLERPVEPKATFAADDEALEQAPEIEQAEAYTEAEVGFQADSPCSDEEQLLASSA